MELDEFKRKALSEERESCVRRNKQLELSLGEQKSQVAQLSANVEELAAQGNKYRARILELEKYYMTEMDEKETKINELQERLATIKKEHEAKFNVETTKANRERRQFATEAQEGAVRDLKLEYLLTNQKKMKQ